MSIPKRFARGELRLHRIEAFSDGVFAPDHKDTSDPHGVRKSLVGPLSYLIGAGVAWLDVRPGFLAYLITPLFYIVPPEAGRSGRPVPP